jgi:hypothetical protein
VPYIFLGKADETDADELMTEIDGIKIFYPSNLCVKEGFSKINIRLRRFLFWSWMELDGARAIAVYNG